ncbi:MAG: tyrosine-type recombinase/integrase [Candidatus Acidiferrales bacterium]
MTVETERPARRERGSGSIYRPKYRTKSGEVRESRFFYIQFYRDGLRCVENTHSDKITPARKLLERRLGSEEFIAPKLERIRFDELAADLVTDYEKNKRRSLRRLRLSLRYLKEFFHGQRAASINGAAISQYVVLRQKHPADDGAQPGISTAAENATVNRELAALRRMFHLGKENGKVRFIPTVKLMAENNVRTGFLEHEQYRTLRAALPDHVRPVLVAMYYSGMRIGEVLAIKWNQVDLDEKEIRLDPGTTKSGEGRTLPLHGEFLDVLRILRDKNSDCPFVFSRSGKPIRSLYQAWRTACVKAELGSFVPVEQADKKPRLKYTGLIPHDLRRTGVRNLVRAGVSRSVAMRISGHETESVFERYNITSREDLHDAAKLLTKYIDGKNDQSMTKVPNVKPARENISPVSLVN